MEIEQLRLRLRALGARPSHEARLLRAGKALAFGEIDIRGADDGKSVCRASTTYALL